MQVDRTAQLCDNIQAQFASVLCLRGDSTLKYASLGHTVLAHCAPKLTHYKVTAIAEHFCGGHHHLGGVWEVVAHLGHLGFDVGSVCACMT